MTASFVVAPRGGRAGIAGVPTREVGSGPALARGWSAGRGEATGGGGSGSATVAPSPFAPVGREPAPAAFAPVGRAAASPTFATIGRASAFAPFTPVGRDAAPAASTPVGREPAPAAFAPVRRAPAPAPFTPVVRDAAPVPFTPVERAAAPAPFTPVGRASAPARRELPRHPALDALAVHLTDPDVTDVFVNGRAGLFVDRGRGAEPVEGWIASDDEVRAFAVALVGLGGRHLDDAAPCVDVRLEGGIRVHAVLPPVAPDGAVVSIRVPAVAPPSLDDLQARGMFGVAGRARLDAMVAERRSVLVTGATGSGKTTLLAALLATAPAGERIVTVEDVAELRIAHPHHVRLEARQANLEGAGGVDLARLVREALRMRPDRLVVGECRGAEVRELLLALNTGHRGGAGTLHASGLSDVAARLEALGALAGMDDRALARQSAGAIEVVLHLDRGADGIRRIVGAGRPVLEGGRLAIEDLAWPA